MNVYIRELSCHTARLGVEVDIFTRRTDPDAPERVEVCDGVNLINITAGPSQQVDKNQLFRYLPDFAHEAAVYSIRHGVRYDVVHAHYWLSGWTAHLLKRYWDTPFVQMFHTTAHMKNAVAPVSQQETPERAYYERKIIELADSIIAANPDERADMIWRQHAPAGKICTIPPGVDTALFRQMDRTHARAVLDLPQDRSIVLFVGRIDPIKGIDVLLQSARTITESMTTPPLILFVGGSLDGDGHPVGPLAEVQAQAEALGVADICRFMGSRPQDQLPLFYSAADITAVPSRYESFGLAAVESMACGTPVVASRVGGLTFTIEDEETGLLVPHGESAELAQAITRLLDDDSLRLSIGSASRHAAERFSWEHVASSVLNLYARLAAGRRANLCCDQEVFA
ncbi:MAG: glycosyltransferase [Thermomicrobiales bacterium]|nr:glycosyltransferase [Thermomicrobiales bacterium]